MKAEEVKEKIGIENWDDFTKFMAGQTVGFDKGIIDYYECDVERFIRINSRFNKTKFWKDGSDK